MSESAARKPGDEGPFPTIDEFLEIAEKVTEEGGDWPELKRALEDNGYPLLASGIKTEGGK